MVVNMGKWFNTEGEPTWRCWSVVWVHVKGEVAEPHHRHAPHTQVATAQAPVPVYTCAVLRHVGDCFPHSYDVDNNKTKRI